MSKLHTKMVYKNFIEAELSAVSVLKSKNEHRVFHLLEFLQTSPHLQIASHMFISSLEGLVSHTFLRCMLKLSKQVK